MADAPNHLKVYFVPVVYGRYEVAFVDEDYTRAVVSGGSLNYLWLLARNPDVEEDHLEEMRVVRGTWGMIRPG